MDWSRAKNILISIFIVLNLFLLAYLGVHFKNNSISKEAINSTVDILKKNGVILGSNCEIPKYNKKTSMLVLENEEEPVTLDGDSSDINSYNTIFYTNIDISDSRKIEKLSRSYLKNQGIRMSNFILDKYIENTNETVTLVFIEKYKEFLVYDNKISLNISEEGIINISLNIKKIKGSTNLPSVVMPAHQALLKNFYNKENVTIESIDIGFKGFDTGHYEQESKEEFQGPTWRIITDKGKDIFLRAYDGEEVH